MGYKKSQTSLPTALLAALIFGLVITLIVAAITASLISSETTDSGAANIGAMLAALLGAATSALVAAGKTGKLRLPMSLAGAAVYFMGLLCLGATLFDGVKSGVGVTALLVASGAIVSWLLGLKREKRPKHKLPKIRK